MGNRTILVDEKWKPKKKMSAPSPLPEVNISPDIKKKHSKAPTPKITNTAKSLKIAYGKIYPLSNSCSFKDTNPA